MSRVSLHNPQHSNSLLQEANRMRLSGTLCDVVIRVESQDFPAHSLVLACVSRTFETLFRTKSVRYSLDFLCSRTFQQILEYSYTDSLEAQTEELDDLLQAAGILAMDGLERQILVATSRIGETEGGDPGVDGSVVRRSEGPPGMGAERDGTLLARQPRRDAAPAAAGLRDDRFPLEKAEGGSPAGEETYRCGIPESARGRGPASAEPSRGSASELEGTGGPGSPDGRGAVARAEDRPIHGTVIAAPARSVPSRQGRIPPLGGGMKWPRHETLLQPYPAHRPLDARSFRALPAFLPPPVSQSPLAFSTTVDFGAFPSPPLQGTSRPEFGCQPREEGNGLVLAGTVRARGASGNPLLMDKQAEEHQRLTSDQTQPPCTQARSLECCHRS
ncbi:zinc finger and BTB domain-containing protein 7A-like [Heterodontus francisci]|uniref:zinc finger and BTB domain-containing protein 7A-like n=1 Tax=Heterodontus francisci TaxID=7792 RepID=UPI00355B6581